MPRTFAPKPDYARKFWKQHGMKPPVVDVIKAVERKLSRIAAEDENADQPCRGRVWQGDAAEPSDFRWIRTRLSLAITSPAYFGMSTYLPDQWLRNWFLGGPAKVDYSSMESLPMSNAFEYTEALGDVWSNLAGCAADEFHLYVRFGAIPSRQVDAKRLLLESLESSANRWRIVSLRDARTADAGKRQAKHMKSHGKAPVELDLHAVLLD